MEFLSKSLKETEEAAKVFLEKLLPRKGSVTVVALSGDLGSGKTTFVQSVARLLGVKENITSPTFVIIKKFSILRHTQDKFFNPSTYSGQVFQFSILYHIDAYRLKNGDELRKLGWDEMATSPRNLIFIEWPENVADAIPKNAIKINFEFIDDKKRRITFIG